MRYGECKVQRFYISKTREKNQLHLLFNRTYTAKGMCMILPLNHSMLPLYYMLFGFRFYTLFSRFSWSCSTSFLFVVVIAIIHVTHKIYAMHALYSLRFRLIVCDHFVTSVQSKDDSPPFSVLPSLFVSFGAVL